MKKKILNLIIAILFVIMLFVLTGCDNNTKQIDETQENKQEKVTESAENIEIKEKLMKVLNDEEKFIGDENSGSSEEEIYFKDFNIYGQKLSFKEYTYVDLNKDGIDELICKTEFTTDPNMIFHYEDGKIYGYTVHNMKDIKTDGTYCNFLTDSTYGYNEMIFIKRMWGWKTLAEKKNDKYLINDKDVSEQKFEKFEEKQNKKENIKWEVFNDSEILNSTPNDNSYNILDFSNTDEIVYLHSDEGDAYSEYTYVLLTLKKDGTITEDYTYPGATGHGAMSLGTYEYKDNQIIANFEKSSNPETPNEFYDFKQTRVYDIKDGKLYNQETPYYTAVYEQK